MNDKNDMPLISVIVPIYNVEAYLERCIKSIVNQTYKELEVILVDDGATDQSGIICDNYSKKDLRIKVIHKENGGLVSARKKGLEYASGKYVAYVDADDWIEPSMYEDMISFSDFCGIDIITAGYYKDFRNVSTIRMDQIDEGIYDKLEIDNNIIPNLFNARRGARWGIFPNVWGKLFVKDLLIKIQMTVNNNICIGEDMAVVFPFIMEAQKLVVLHKCYYHYCYREGSISQKNKSDQQEINDLQLLNNYLNRKMDSYVGKYKKELYINYSMYWQYIKLLRCPRLVMKSIEGKIYPFDNLYINDDIVIYGKGGFGRAVHGFLKDVHWCNILSHVDGLGDEKNINYIKDIVKETNCKIVIGIMISEIIEELLIIFKDMRIPRDRIAVVEILPSMD